MKHCLLPILLILCAYASYAQFDSTLNWKRISSFDGTDAAPLFSNYYEATYGFGLSQHNHYLGLNYTHRFDRIGVSASAIKGIGNKSITLMAGPSYSIGMNNRGGNWHIYSGLGASWSDSLSFACQIGLRYSFNEGYLDHTETWSLSAGISYLNHEWVPTVGVSIMPAVLQIGDWWGEKEYRYPRHYGELMGSIGPNGFLFGTNYAYVPSKIGLYGSFLYGGEEDLFAHVGPVVRLNNSENWPVDIQLFQGIGFHHGEIYDMIEYHDGVSGETGVRFGFGRDRKYGMWSLSTSAVYTKDYLGATLGMSWPIAGITAAAAGIVLYLYAVVSTGSDMPDVSNWGSSSSSSSSSNGGSTKGGNCDSYQRQYNELEADVMEMYQNMDFAAHHGSSTSFNSMSKQYHQKQSQMKRIRLKARQNGCTISASKWETKMWNGSFNSPFAN